MVPTKAVAAQAWKLTTSEPKRHHNYKARKNVADLKALSSQGYAEADESHQLSRPQVISMRRRKPLDDWVDLLVNPGHCYLCSDPRHCS